MYMAKIASKDQLRQASLAFEKTTYDIFVYDNFECHVMFHEYHDVKKVTQGTIGQVAPFLRFCKLSRDVMFEEGGRVLV